MEACGGAAEGLRLDRKRVRTTPPGLGLTRGEVCGKTIELELRSWNPALLAASHLAAKGKFTLIENRGFFCIPERKLIRVTMETE